MIWSGLCEWVLFEVFTRHSMGVATVLGNIAIMWVHTNSHNNTRLVTKLTHMQGTPTRIKRVHDIWIHHQYLLIIIILSKHLAETSNVENEST